MFVSTYCFILGIACIVDSGVSQSTVRFRYFAKSQHNMKAQNVCFNIYTGRGLLNIEKVNQ